MNLSQAVAAKRSQWAREAILFNAAHGRRGGAFATSRWADGRVMVGPVGCLPNQEIPVEVWGLLRAQGWTWRG